MLRAQLNVQLYQKMCAEQEMFREWLLFQTPRTVLESAWAYVMRESVLRAMENYSLNPRQAQLLLKEPFPLASVYSKLEGWETSNNKQAWKAIEARANELVQCESMKRRDVDAIHTTRNR